MSSLWLNTLSSGVVEIERRPEFSRDTLYGDIDEVTGDAKHRANSVDWDLVGEPIVPIDPLSQFQVLTPKLEGLLAPVALEREVLKVSFDWFLQLINRIEDQEVLEASVLLMAFITIPEEKSGHKINKENTPLVFGYSLDQLLGILGQVLVPSVIKRLTRLVIHSVNLQVDRNSSSRRSQSHTLRKISFSYDNYLRWRAIDGYTEAFMLCVFAILGESCQFLTAGVANDIIEAVILIHDSHSASRHFSEGEIANCHRYMQGGPGYSIPTALQRATFLRHKILMDPKIPDTIKEGGVMLISNSHTLGYSCARYKYGRSLAKLVSVPKPAPLVKLSQFFSSGARSTRLVNQTK